MPARVWLVMVVPLLWVGRAGADCHVTVPPVQAQACGSGSIFTEETYCTDDTNGACLGAYITIGLGQDNMFIRKATFACAAGGGQCDCRPAYDAIVAYCGSLACGGGTCDVGDKCCSGKCIPYNSVCCPSGEACPSGTACSSDGKCCPDGLPVFDANSGYCCGQTDPNNTSTICECGNPCPAIQGCCAGGKVCCSHGWCADNAGDCPDCPASAPTWCPDGTCAPAGAVCCGRGFYCPNGLSCAEAGGQFKCGSGGTSNAGNTVQPTSAGGSPPARTAVQPSGAPTPGKVPGSGGTTAGSTTSPLPLAPGCGCQLTGAPAAGWLLLAPLLLLLRRRRGR
jgi:hypothetical protein